MRSILAVCLFIVAGTLGTALAAPARRVASAVDQCQTGVAPDSDKVDCLSPCSSQCQTRVPIPLPGVFGATYTYCYCTNGGPAEPRCCHAIRVRLADGSYYAQTKGPCGISSCPDGVTCSLGLNEETGYSVGLCVSY